jgi:hypothetical protein
MFRPSEKRIVPYSSRNNAAESEQRSTRSPYFKGRHAGKKPKLSLRRHVND